MAGETPITVIGNLTADPELRFTPSGAAVANFTVASTPRTFDKQTNEWKDGEALFLSCSVWRQAAENAAESLVRGMRVIVSGRLKARSYETREGEKRTVFEIDVDEVGPSLKYATAKVSKTTRSAAAAVAVAAATAAATTRGRPAAQQASAVGPAASRRLRRRAGAVSRADSSRRPADDPWASSGPAALGRAPVLTADAQLEHLPGDAPGAPTNHSGPDIGRVRAQRRSTTMAKPVLRKPKKKVCQFCKDKTAYVDYKDTTLLRKFISDRGKIRARRVTGNCVQHQRDVAIAVKNAREVALLPYTSTAR